MIEEYDFRSEEQDQTDKTYEIALRPKQLEDFAGQSQVVENLRIFVSAAKMREESLDHVLLHGPPGLGKTTLAQIISNEMEVGIKISSGPVLDKPGDLAGLLTNLETGDKTFAYNIRKEETAEADEYFKKAIPSLEKSLIMNPNDYDTLYSLEQIYYKTGNYEKSKEMKDRKELLKR